MYGTVYGVCNGDSVSKVCVKFKVDWFGESVCFSKVPS